MIELERMPRDYKWSKVVQLELERLLAFSCSILAHSVDLLAFKGILLATIFYLLAKRELYPKISRCANTKKLASHR